MNEENEMIGTNKILNSNLNRFCYHTANSANGIQREIKVKGQKLGTVRSFKYLEAIVSGDDSKPEVLSRIAKALYICSSYKAKANLER